MTARPDHCQRPLLLSARAAARETGIPYTSLRDLAHRGELRVIHVGRAWYFLRRDIEQWVASRLEVLQ